MPFVLALQMLALALALTGTILLAAYALSRHCVQRTEGTQKQQSPPVVFHYGDSVEVRDEGMYHGMRGEIRAECDGEYLVTLDGLHASYTCAWCRPSHLIRIQAFLTPDTANTVEERELYAQ